jgi:PAS domain S-box-containing protein
MSQQTPPSNSQEVEVARLQQRIRELEQNASDRGAEIRLASLAIPILTTTGPKFFEALVQHLTRIFECKTAVLGVLDEQNPAKVQTLAFFHDGKLQENIDYELSGSASENVCASQFCYYSDELQSKFAGDSMLHTLDAHYYAGMPVQDTASGRVIGLVAVLAAKPLPPRDMVETTLRIVALRAAAEIERLRIEQQLHASQAELRRRYEELASIYHTAPVGLVFYNTDLRITNVNERVCELDGVSREDHIGKRLSELFPKLAVREEACMQRVLDTGIPIIDEEIETPDTTINGKRQVLRRSVVPQKDATGRTIGLNVVFVNITQEKLNEAALRVQDHAMRSALGGIVLGAMDGTINWVNPALEAMTGYCRDELVGGPGHFAVHSPEQLAAARQELMQKGGWSGEMELRRKDGRKVDMLIHSSIVKDAAGVPLCTMSWCEDISERKQAEKERDHLIAQLEAKNAELERFTYTVSHDLKSPLVTITGFLGMLEHDLAANNQAAVREDMQEISLAAARMKQLLDELLQLSRIGRVVNPPRQINLGELVQSVVQPLANVLAENRIELVVAEDLPTVYGDVVRLTEVLQNLIDNAIKFSRKASQPRITIGWRPGDGCDVIYIRDNGVGIERPYLQRIFDLFEQLDPGVGGSGIGLAIAKRIVEVHGGAIWAESAGVGQGATFLFSLPRHESCDTDAA